MGEIISTAYGGSQQEGPYGGRYEVSREPVSAYNPVEGYLLNPPDAYWESIGARQPRASSRGATPYATRGGSFGGAPPSPSQTGTQYGVGGGQMGGGAGNSFGGGFGVGPPPQPAPSYKVHNDVSGYGVAPPPPPPPLSVTAYKVQPDVSGYGIVPTSYKVQPDGRYVIASTAISQMSKTADPQLLHVFDPIPFPTTKDTLLIWDWDDTLMASTAINSNQVTQQQARQLDGLMEQVLTLSLKLGETCIVTNADENWVRESMRRFAPRGVPFLSQVPVLSARRRWETRFPGDTFAWKRETFKEILDARLKRGFQQSLNLITLGDSMSEISAAYRSTVGKPFKQMAVKTVKFQEHPAADELLDQLRLVVEELGLVVAEEKGSHRDLREFIAARRKLQGYWAVAPLSPTWMRGRWTLASAPTTMAY